MITPLYQALGPLGWKRGGGQASIYSLASDLWKLDEESDGSVSVPRLATIGGLDLTDNNTVASAAKGVGAPANLPANVASFVAGSSEYLSRAAFVAPNSWSFAGWIYTVSGTSAGGILTAIGSWPNNVQLAIYYADASAQVIVLAGDGSSFVFAAATALPRDSWHFVAASYDQSDKKLRVSVDGGSEVASSALSGTPYRSASTLKVNGNDIGGGFWSTTASMFALFPLRLDADQIAGLWNGGAGAPPP